MTNEEAAIAIWDVYEASRKKLDAFIEKSGEGNPKVREQKSMLIRLEQAGWFIRNKKSEVESLRLRLSRSIDELNKVLPASKLISNTPSEKLIEALNNLLKEVREIEEETQDIIVNENFNHESIYRNTI